MKRTILVSLLTGAVLISSPVFANDKTVLEQLKVMQEQLVSMKEEIDALKKDLSSATARAEAAEKKAAAAPKAASGKAAEATGSDVKVTLTPGPKFETADGETSFKIGGFVQVDAGMFDDDVVDQPNGTTVRRARMNMSGTIAKDFRYKLENDFSNNVSSITDAYLEYAGLNPVTLTVGQFKEPFGLETLTSDLHTSFVERASVYAFSPDRNLGAMVSANGDSGIGNWTASLGGFGSGTGTASTDDESTDVTGRLTLAPIAEKDKVVHLGVAASHRVPDSATDSMRFSSRPETRLTSAQAVDTGTIAGVDDVNLLGLEAAAVFGPASLQGEYVMANVDRDAASSLNFDGYYAEATYFLTGESRTYKADQAKFDRVKPNHLLSLSQGTWGAWQVAARYSNLDLNDAAILGGEMDNITLGLRWYPNANVTVMGNYIRANTDGDAVAPNDDPQAWLLRTQFDF